jgi:hypothetical protein
LNVSNSTHSHLFVNGTTGNVGIGTTSPETLLNIRGNTPILTLEDTVSNAKGSIYTITGNVGSTPTLGFGFPASEGSNRSINFRMNGNNIMTILGNGSVGIGTISPAYKLDVAGQAHATSFPTSSDIRFKDNITKIDNVLAKIDRINGVYFEWNDLYKQLGRATPGRQIGLIAQEVEEQFPELVSHFNAGNISDARSVDYGRFTAVLLEAIKEQQKQIEELNEMLKSQQTEIEQLKQLVGKTT